MHLDLNNFCRIGRELPYDRIDEVLLRLGLRDPGKEAPDEEFYRRFADQMRKPFLPGQPHEFGREEELEEIKALVPLGMSKMLRFKPSRELVYINRALGGHYGNLRRLRAKACFGDIVAAHLGTQEEAEMNGAATANVQ